MKHINVTQVYSFGLGVFGQLGHGVTRDERFPRRIESLVPSDNGEAGERLVAVACGYVSDLNPLFVCSCSSRQIVLRSCFCRSQHTLALGVSGTVWTWGSAEYGQQGGTNAYEDWATGTISIMSRSPNSVSAPLNSRSSCRPTRRQDSGPHLCHAEALDGLLRWETHRPHRLRPAAQSCHRSVGAILSAI